MVVSCPPILALYEEDIRDSLEYLQIPSWTGNEVVYKTPNEMLVAFTGHGLKDMNGPDGTAKNVLLIEYTQEALSLACDHVNSGGSRRPGKQNANFNAGSRQSNTAAHWALVQMDVERAIKFLIPTWKPTVDPVLLVGESSDDEELRKRIGLVVAPFGNPEIISSDGLYVAAKGTAEVAWSYVKAEGRARGFGREGCPRLVIVSNLLRISVIMSNYVSNNSTTGVSQLRSSLAFEG